MAAVEATEVAESAQTFEARVAATEQVMRRAYDNSLLVEPALPLSPVHRSRSPQPSPRRLDAMHEAAEAAFEAADLAGLDSAIRSIQLGEAAAAAKAAEAAEATEGAYETAKSYARRSLESSARCQRGVDDGEDSCFLDQLFDECIRLRVLTGAQVRLLPHTVHSHPSLHTPHFRLAGGQAHRPARQRQCHRLWPLLRMVPYIPGRLRSRA